MALHHRTPQGELEKFIVSVDKLLADFGDDQAAVNSRQSNNTWTPKTVKQFKTTYPDRHIFYAVLEKKARDGTSPPDTILDHMAGNAKGDGVQDFDAGLYAWRVEGQRYLVSVGKDYPLTYIQLSLPCVSAETPQLDVPESCEPILKD